MIRTSSASFWIARAFSGDKPALADRTADGRWRTLSFADLAAAVRAAGQWFVDHLPRGATVMIVADNSPQVAVAYVAGLAAGLRVLPVGTATALAGDDLARLRHVAAKARPAAAFVQNDAHVLAAVRAAVGQDCAIVTTSAGIDGTINFAELVATRPTRAIDDAIEHLDVTATACLMMTSGSSGLPKLVELSLANLAANTAQGLAALGRLAGWSEASMDWLPWNHAAGSAVLRASLMLGGTLYIDRGKPVPGLFDETIRNLREIAVPYFNNVPLGYAMLTDALESDPVLRRTFFQRMRVMIYGGAGLPQSIMDRLRKLAMDETGRPVPVTTGYGATETVAGCLTIHFECDRVGIGLPAPGVEVKLVPADDRFALFLRGPNIMRGYLDDPDRTADAFDEEGYYRTGDLVRFQDEVRPELGLVFAGRQSEEFKLSNGSWVYGGQLRTRLLDALSPIAMDVVLCDEDKPFLSLLVWPNDKAGTDILTRTAAILRDFNHSRRGAASRIRRVALLEPPPDPVKSEISDKGSLVRRPIIDNRPDLIARLYAGEPDDGIVSLT